MKLQRVGHDWVNKHITMFVCLIWWFLPLLCLSLGLHSPHIPLYFLLLSLPAMGILCCCWFSLFCFFVLFKLSESSNLYGRTIKEYKEENKRLFQNEVFTKGSLQKTSNFPIHLGQASCFPTHKQRWTWNSDILGDNLVTTGKHDFYLQPF